jgi:hypothetical protein
MAQAPPPRDADPAGTFAFLLESDTLAGSDHYDTSGLLFAWRSSSYDPPDWLATLADMREVRFRPEAPHAGRRSTKSRGLAG